MTTAPDEASHSEESLHSEPTSTTATTHSSEHPRNETSAAANATTPPSHPPEDEFAEPQLAALHAIFPDFDAALLQSVLESVGGNQDRAVDALLGMSDPDYVPSAQEQAAPRSQTELDEEFARQLMLEEQQQQQQQQQTRPRWQPSPNAQSRPQSQSQPFANAPYDSRTGAPQTGPQKDTMAEVQEQFTKFAETGKRTFSSIVSKVKAKVQEFDQQRSGQGAAGTQPSWGSSSTAQPEYDRHSQQAYHAPAREEPRLVRATYPATQGYDLTTPSSVSPSSQVVPSISPPITSNEPSRNTTSPGTSSSVATPPPPTTISGPPTVNIDPGKVGLLPKRPVSLIRPSDQSAAQSHILDDDKSEDLEYMENPFEDHGRK